MTKSDRDPAENSIVSRFFAAMQAGAAAAEAMMELFAEEAIYIEPFSGIARKHRGKQAIRSALEEGWANPLPEMRIEADTIDFDGQDRIKVEWTCYSPALPAGKGRGRNTYLISDGLIRSLTTEFI